MRLGLQTGYIPPRVTLDGIAESLQSHLVNDPEQSVFYQPCINFPASVDETHRLRLRKEMQAVIRELGRAGLSCAAEIPPGRVPSLGSGRHRCS